MPFDEGHLRKVLLERLEADLVVSHPQTQLAVRVEAVDASSILERHGLFI